MRKLLLSLLLLCCHGAFAATLTAVTNGNWTTAATWGGTVPQASDIAIIPAGITVTHNVGINGNMFNNWNNAGTIRVTGKLVLQGTEPVLTNPVAIEILSGGEFRDESQNGQIYLNPTSSFKVFTGGKLTSIIETIIYNKTTPSASYAFSTTTVNGPFNVSVSGSSTTFSTVVLPLTLVSFTGKKLNVNNVLSWQTQSEVNTDNFLIERSTDGKDYQTVGKVAAKASTGSNNYSFVDRSALNGDNIYRLKMTDIDGAFTYSDILVSLKREALSSINVYPSPAKDVLFINSDQNEVLTIYNLEGKSVFSKNLKAGTNSVDVSLFKDGVYFVEQAGQKTSFIKTSK
ncbi:T9SS type A sorting domain-containing protein [Nubsella zeaxanthinifaciens]|uniref:T9SS type A sorting domain-containing protein n=1 Tax=Nubsella zeaxanthinifaciens TaxID=392412 RepID=UPI000DE325A7|nr:T9SS type A sorting domain-containing protein [Nubsella zeaxanthinifaciens]